MLAVVDVERPTPGAGQVLLRVAASAYNAADAGMRGGFLPIPIELPHVPGYDVSGTVDAIGDGVEGLAVGDAVIGFLPMERDGGAAEYVVAPADALVPAPSRIPLGDAAALPSVALTAWQALFDDGHLEAGQRVLIVGAGGVVGKYAVQLAKRAGVAVVANREPPQHRRGPRRRRRPGRRPHHHRAARRTDGQVDVLLNLAPIDPEQFAADVAAVRDGGTVVSTTAFMATPDDAERDVHAATVFVRPDRQRLAELVALVDAGELTVEVTRRIALAGPAGAARRGRGRTVAGKVVVLA